MKGPAKATPRPCRLVDAPAALEKTLEATVKRVFPEARKDPEGWRVPRPPGAKVASQTGTYDPKTLFVA
jgi:hypothetical protein